MVHYPAALCFPTAVSRLEVPRYFMSWGQRSRTINIHNISSGSGAGNEARQ